MADKNPFFGATFAERKAARLAAEDSPPATKAVDEDVETTENKAVSPKKRTTKRTKST